MNHVVDVVAKQVIERRRSVGKGKFTHYGHTPSLETTVVHW